MMPRTSLLGWVTAWLVLGSGLEARAAPQDYLLAVSGPTVLRGSVGALLRQKYTATLEDVGNTGTLPPVEGWTLAITVRGARVLGATVVGTAGLPALSGGTAETEVVDVAGGQAILSRVRLPESITVHATRQPTPLLAFEIEAEVPPADILRESTVTIEFDPATPGSSGVEHNALLAGGEELEPRLEAVLAVPLVDESSVCEHSGDRILVGFSSQNVSSPFPFDAIEGDETSRGELEVQGDGKKSSVRVFAGVVSLLEATHVAGPSSDAGIQGFSLSIGVDGDLDCMGATVRGTAWERGPGANGGFTVAECVDPGKNNGRRGLTAAAVLSFWGISTLPPVGTYSLVDIALETSAPQGSPPPAGRLQFEDGLRGRAQPVQNWFTVNGASVRPCNFDQAELTIRVRQPTFLRGDANSDLKLDVSDPVTLLRSQFLGDAHVRCDDAGDANDDGKLDIADAVFTFGYLYLGFREPPPPFPEPGVDPTPDALGCRSLLSTR